MPMHGVRVGVVVLLELNGVRLVVTSVHIRRHMAGCDSRFSLRYNDVSFLLLWLQLLKQA